MTPKNIAAPEEKIRLSGISWQTYEILLAELSVHRRLRLTYHRGSLEISDRFTQPERYKKILARFIEVIAEELNIPIYSLESTTFKYPEVGGAEPDECFYIQHINTIQGKHRIDLSIDPPPDLVIEIEMGHRSENRYQVYADMQVPEIWLYDGNKLTIEIRHHKQYIPSDRSLAFPTLPVAEISQLLEQVHTTDPLQLVQSFRHWVRSQIQPEFRQ